MDKRVTKLIAAAAGIATAPQSLALETAAVAMFDALSCAGVARVDFFLTADGPVLK